MRTARITATLPTEYITQLKALTDEKLVPSVNYAVKEAVEAYLKQAKKNRYETLMAEAANDNDFMSRTMECSNDFAHIDSEVLGEW